HPELGGKIEVLSGRFGPYIKFAKVNATIPKNIAPEAVTLEEAVRLIAAKMENGGSKTKARGKAKTAKPKAAVANGKTNGAKPESDAKKPKASAKKTPAKAASKAN
ncbi:MAG: topoisomerase C-terminal repeat-containing protein, partial [Rhodomicrobium sp.]